MDPERCTGSGRFRRCNARESGTGDGRIFAPRRFVCAIAALAAAQLVTRVAGAQPAEPAATPQGAPVVTETTVRPPETTLVPPPRAGAAVDDDLSALRAEVRALRADVAHRDAMPPPPAPTTEPPTTSPPPRSKSLGYEEFWPWVLPPEGLSVGGYVQAQYETHQDSQDQLNANGSALNKDRFSVRRARVSLTGEWQYAAMVVQLDANTTNGPQVDLRKAEASLQYRPDRTRPPLLMATVGLFDIPFGFETVEASHTRFFMEETTASKSLFPGQADLGARLAAALGFFRATLAIQNGEPVSSTTPFVVQDPNSAKDVVARFGFDAAPRPNVQLAGSVSGLTGQGFHPGGVAAGSSLQWHDVNGDGAVQASELVGVGAQSATSSQNFARWAVGADLRTSIRWWPGVLKVYGELVLAQNLDRGLYVADPILTGVDQRELGFYVAALQEVTRWGIVGVRYDLYDPNANFFDKRGGSLIPTSEAIQTVSPLVGMVLPDRARLLLQYDVIHNAFARDALGVPTSLANNVLTLRLQVQL